MAFRFRTLAVGLLMGLGLVSATGEAYARGCGGASWYALRSKTASGERMNPAR